MKITKPQKSQRYQYVGTRLTDDDKELLTAYCDSYGVSVAEGLKQLIDQWLKTEHKKRQRIQEVGPQPLDFLK